ncbi:hypothetical protein AB0I28_19760 [Phytomonospora sp. NPDC050363]|uniref:hypothetical protein n=1 Tax=Phytomonospora sp. NPDC050363 TaxID=3155642 RepID=UPI0033CDED27
MKDSIEYGRFARSNGNEYVVRGEPNIAGFRIYRDQGNGNGYLLGSVSDPEAEMPELKVDGGRLLTVGAAQECLKQALEVWFRAMDGEP